MANERLHLLNKGFETGEIVVANQDNTWIASTFKTCDVSPEEHEALMRDLIASYNAIRMLDDLFAEPQRDDHDAVDASIRAEQIVRHALNGKG